MLPFANSSSPPSASVDTELFVIKQYEEEINYKMETEEGQESGFYYKFNEKVLFRTDSKTQMEYLKNGVGCQLDVQGREFHPQRHGQDFPDVLCPAAELLERLPESLFRTLVQFPRIFKRRLCCQPALIHAVHELL